EEGFDRHRVVDAHGGDVARGQAVAQHLHARAVQSADDRPADAGTEVRGLHAGQASDRLAQGGGADFVEAAAGQHFHRPGQRLGGLRKGRGAHHALVQALDFSVARIVLGGERGQGAQGKGESGGETPGDGGGGRHGAGLVRGVVMLYYYVSAIAHLSTSRTS